VPYQARRENQKSPWGRHHPLFLTPEVITGLRARADNGQPVNFRCDVWPLIDLEVRAVYYTTLVRERNCHCDAESFLLHFVGLAKKNGIRATADPLVTDSSVAERALLASAGITDDEVWDRGRIARPYAGQVLHSTTDYRTRLRSYLDNDVAEARLGNGVAPGELAGRTAAMTHQGPARVPATRSRLDLSRRR
jgi:hypothetical protein